MAIGRIIRRGVQRAVAALRRRTNRRARRPQTLTPEQGKIRDALRKNRRKSDLPLHDDQPKPKRRSPGAEPRRERDPITEEALRKPRKNTARPEARKRPDSVPEYLRRRPPVPPGTRKKALDWPWPYTEVKPKRRPAKPQKPDGGIVSTK